MKYYEYFKETVYPLYPSAIYKWISMCKFIQTMKEIKSLSKEKKSFRKSSTHSNLWELRVDRSRIYCANISWDNYINNKMNVKYFFSNINSDNWHHRCVTEFLRAFFFISKLIRDFFFVSSWFIRKGDSHCLFDNVSLNELSLRFFICFYYEIFTFVSSTINTIAG